MNDPQSAHDAGGDALPDSLRAELASWCPDRAPERDLWPAVAARIRSQRAPARRSPLDQPWLAAAACLVATVVTVFAVTVRAPATRHTPLQPSTPQLAAMTAAERAARDGELQAVSTRTLRHETRALVRANLKIVSNAESQLRSAINQDPDDAYLQNLLATAQAQKQELRVALADAPR